MSDPLVCYTIGDDYVTSSNQYFPCGSSDASGANAQSCCHAGDYCLEDSICRYTHRGVVNGTGYYLAGCTDSSWNDPACPKQCASEYGSDIVYNRARSTWQCCHSTDGYLDCQQPTDLKVKAPGPLDLSTIQQLSTAIPSSIAMTGVGSVTLSQAATLSNSAFASSTPASAPHKQTSSSSTADSSSSAGLSTGAKAGIGVAVIVGMLLLFGGGWLFYQRNKRRHEKFQPFSETASAYSRTNRSHTTLASRGPRSMDTRRETFASRTTATTAYNTNRNTYASSYYQSEPGSVMMQQEPVPPLPEGADGIQVVKQLPRTPGDKVANEKIAVEEVERDIGPFEMNDEEYEMQARKHYVQELEGTTVPRAELDAVSRRSCTAESVDGPDKAVSVPTDDRTSAEPRIPNATHPALRSEIEREKTEK